MKKTFNNTFIIATATIIALCLVFVFTPLPAAHADSPNAPDGSHTIAQIFPDPAVAQDIADQIASSDTSYTPQNAADFDMVTTLSLPYYNVASLEGIQYCLKLKYLYVPGNKLKNSDLSVVSALPLLTHINISSGADITSDVFGILKNLPLIRLAANCRQLCLCVLDMPTRSIRSKYMDSVGCPPQHGKEAIIETAT